MSKKLEGKVALITGGSRGIGAAIAKRLAADGATIAITYTKGGDAAVAVVKAIERAGGKAIAIQADAADADAGKAAVEKTVATFGRLDVLVTSAPFVYVMAIFAPSTARRLAIAAPMPREPPVMSATFPSNFFDIVYLLELDICSSGMSKISLLAQGIPITPLDYPIGLVVAPLKHTLLN